MELTSGAQPVLGTTRGPSRCRPAGVLVAALLVVAGPAMALPVELVPGPPVEGSELAVEPAVLRPSPGTTSLVLRLGAAAPAPVVVTARARTVTLTGDGTARPGDTPAPWLVVPTTSTLLRPGERIRLPVVVVDQPPDGLGAVVVRGAPTDGQPQEVTALLLGPGGPHGDAGPQVTATRDDGLVDVDVTVARPSLVTVRVVGRDLDATLPDRVVLPAAPLRVTVAAGSLPTPVTITAVDDAGREATAVTAWAVAPVAVATIGAVAVLLALALVVRRRRRH